VNELLEVRVVGRNLRCQLLDPFEHGAVEVVQLLPLQSPVEDFADFSAGQSKFDVIHLVDHRVLVTFQSVICQKQSRGRKPTLIIVRTTLTEPKTGLAGVMLENSFAMFIASMATFKVEITPSCSLGFWDLSAMVGTQGGCEEVRRRVGWEEEIKPQ